jgi:hypothetical protein
MVIVMAETGKSPEQISQALDERWGIEYPATNNAVLNGGIVAMSVWLVVTRASCVGRLYPSLKQQQRLFTGAPGARVIFKPLGS